MVFPRFAPCFPTRPDPQKKGSEAGRGPGRDIAAPAAPAAPRRSAGSAAGTAEGQVAEYGNQRGGGNCDLVEVKGILAMGIL